MDYSTVAVFNLLAPPLNELPERQLSRWVQVLMLAWHTSRARFIFGGGRRQDICHSNSSILHLRMFDSHSGWRCHQEAHGESHQRPNNREAICAVPVFLHYGHTCRERVQL